MVARVGSFKSGCFRALAEEGGCGGGGGDDIQKKLNPGLLFMHCSGVKI